MTGFEDLDDDVLYLILDYLYLERVRVLHSLRLTSSRLKDFADAVAHRSVSLIDDEAHEQITYRLTERLTDPSDKLCHYVRDLCVVNFNGDLDSFCLNNALIVKCLDHIQRLDSFSWESDAPVPSKMWDILRQRFPNAQFCAKVKRIERTVLPTMQLHRLDISVSCLSSCGEYSTSLFGPLKQALLRITSLRQLSIDTHIDANIEQEEESALNRLQIPLEAGDKLPALVSLELRSKSYAFDLDHCTRLRSSMDFDKLRHLTLGSANPRHFFELFRGAMPSLTHLDVSYVSSKADPRHRRLDSLSSFVAELASLRSLVFRCNKLHLHADFPKMLAARHGPTLVHLSLQATQENVEGHCLTGNTRKFLWRFTNLQTLDIAFPDIRSYHRCPDCVGPQLGDADQFSFVPPLPSLRNLNLSICAPSNERALYASINKHAHCAICHLWVTFTNRTASQLETLSIRFWRWEMTGRQTCLKEVFYDTVRLRSQLMVKVRNRREIPVVVYREIWDYNCCMGSRLVAFEVEDQ